MHIEIFMKGKKVKVKSLSCVQLFATPWTVASQAPLSMENILILDLMVFTKRFWGIFFFTFSVTLRLYNILNRLKICLV